MNKQQLGATAKLSIDGWTWKSFANNPSTQINLI